MTPTASRRSTTSLGKPRKPRKKSEGAYNPGWENFKKAVPFKKNNPITGEKDPRINRTGLNAKATSQKELEKAIQNFLNASSDGDKATVLDDLLNIMLNGQALDRKTLMEYGFGKKPTPIQAKFDGPLTIKFVDETEDDDPDTAGDDDGSDAAG